MDTDETQIKQKHPQIPLIFADEMLQIGSALICDICGQNLFPSVFHLCPSVAKKAMARERAADTNT
jgi:hypothetical protein